MLRKYLLIASLLFSLSFIAFSQKIELKLSNQGKLKVFNKVLIEVYLVNNTSKKITYFNSLNTSWDSFREAWGLTVNDQPVSVHSFTDGHEGRYTEETIIDLLPGESKMIRAKLVDLNSPGHYCYTYTQEQSPLYVVEGYAKTSTAYAKSKSITKFKVSGSVKFDVEDIETVSSQINKVEMTWEEWKIYVEQKKVYSEDKCFLDIQEALKNPNDVYLLHIDCTGLNQNMIERIANFPNLRDLALNGLTLKQFPVALTKMNLFKLRLLLLEGSTIDIPDEFAKMDSLRVLSVSCMSKAIPENFLHLKNLEELSFSSSPIEYLPDMSSLHNLKTFMLNYALIGDLKPAKFDQIPTLKTLDISRCKKIESIEPVLKCTNLEVLKIPACSIKEIPNDICNLRQLKTIDLGFNQISSVPECIGQLSKLKEIDLQQNTMITVLPGTFLQLKDLEDLNISTTGIKQLPEGIAELPLKAIYIYDSPCKKTKDYKMLKDRLKKSFRD